MGKLPKPYLSRSMNNIVVLSLSIIAVFFLYRYIKSLENDIIKLRIEMDEMSSKRAPSPLPSGGSAKLAAAAFQPSPAPMNTEREEPLTEDDESIRSEDLTCMLRAVLVNDGIACVNIQEEPVYDTNKVEVCETEEEEHDASPIDDEDANESVRSAEDDVGAESIPSEPLKDLNPNEIRDILSGKTCEQLRSLLKERGIENLKGKKAELVERIMSS